MVTIYTRGVVKNSKKISVKFMHLLNNKEQEYVSNLLEKNIIPELNKREIVADYEFNYIYKKKYPKDPIACDLLVLILNKTSKKEKVLMRTIWRVNTHEEKSY